MKGVSEGKWRWVELQCWFVLSVPATHSFFLNWLIYSLTASDGCSNTKAILSLVFEFPVKSMWESGQRWRCSGRKKKKPSRLKNCFYYHRHSFGGYGFSGYAMMSSSEFKKWELKMHCQKHSVLKTDCDRLKVALLVLLMVLLCHFRCVIFMGLSYGAKISWKIPVPSEVFTPW